MRDPPRLLKQSPDQYQSVNQTGQNLTAVLNSPHVSASEYLFGLDIIEGVGEAIESLWEEQPAEVIPPEYAPGYGPEDIDLQMLSKYANEIHRGYRLWQGHRLLKAGSAEQKQAEAQDVACELETCMSEVPEEYFDPNFTLSKSSVLLNTGQKNAHTAMLTQEKLSNYLDLVEINLLRQIYSQSDAFFEALENIQNIHTDVTQTIASISHIRGKIKTLRECSIGKALRVVQARTRQKNVSRLIAVGDRIRDVLLCRDRVRELMSVNDFGTALQMIQESEKVMDTELKGVKCLESVREYFNEITQQTKGKLITQFLELTKQEDSRETTERMEVLVGAIAKMDELHQLLRLYMKQVKDDILQSVKIVFWESMEEIPDDPFGNKDENLSQINAQLTSHIQNLPHQEFLEVWARLFDNLYLKLQRVRVVEKLISNTIKTNLGEETINKFTKTLDTLRLTACEFSLQRCSKLLGLREEIHSCLELPRLKEIVVKTMTFIRKVEKLAGELCYEIRGTIVTQTKNFLEYFHQQRLERMKNMMDEEMWTAGPVHAKIQLLLENNFQETDSIQTVRTPVNWDDTDCEDAEEGDVDENDSNMLDEIVLEIKGEQQKFKVVQSCVGLLEMIREYVDVCESLQAICPDVLTRLMKLVQTFNHRAYQLILCAVAINQVGLKSISARHLSVTYSCISLLSYVMPKLIIPFIENLESNRRKLLTLTLNKCLEDLSEHQKELHKKLVGIMKSQIDSQCEEFLKCSWISERPGPDDPLEFRPDEPISGLMRRTKYMHKILTQYLGEHKRDLVFREVTMYFASKLFGTLECIADEEDKFVKTRLHLNAKFVLERLKKIDCSSDELQQNLSKFIF